MAGCYENYDAIYPLTNLSDESIPLDSPDKPLRVNLSKRYGSTIDVATAENPDIANGETNFELWANIGNRGNHRPHRPTEPRPVGALRLRHHRGRK